MLARNPATYAQDHKIFSDNTPVDSAAHRSFKLFVQLLMFHV
jgi:hypothetical protein